jgi:hypothetical protein
MHPNLKAEITREILKGCHLADEYARMVGARVYIPAYYIIEENGHKEVVPIHTRELNERLENNNGKET